MLRTVTLSTRAVVWVRAPCPLQLLRLRSQLPHRRPITLGRINVFAAKALELREQYVFRRECPEWEDEGLARFDEAARLRPFAPDWVDPQPDLSSEYSFNIGADCVAQVSRRGSPVREWQPPNLANFSRDLEWLWDMCNGKSERTIAHKRLSMLKKNFTYYHEMNWSYEAEEIRWSRSDFSRGEIR